jgi:glycosyltransferase involved in cell wall biosynthesis
MVNQVPTLYSHTIVKNGQPFIRLVLEQVEPYVDKMLVTVSEKSADGTRDVLSDLQSKWKGKLVVDTENITKPSELTMVRQKQLDRTQMDSWVLFLDADDLWFSKELQEMKFIIDKKNDIDGYSVNPYQVVSEDYYDTSWRNRYFLKWFKKQEDVHYEHPWPRDLVYKGRDVLYWKTNNRVPKVSVHFFHLANLMRWRFRDEPWALEYKTKLGNLAKYPKNQEMNIKKIFDYKP